MRRTCDYCGKDLGVAAGFPDEAMFFCGLECAQVWAMSPAGAGPLTASTPGIEETVLVGEKLTDHEIGMIAGPAMPAPNLKEVEKAFVERFTSGPREPMSLKQSTGDMSLAVQKAFYKFQDAMAAKKAAAKVGEALGLVSRPPVRVMLMGESFHNRLVVEVCRGDVPILTAQLELAEEDRGRFYGGGAEVTGVVEDLYGSEGAVTLRVPDGLVVNGHRVPPDYVTLGVSKTVAHWLITVMETANKLREE